MTSEERARLMTYVNKVKALFANTPYELHVHVSVEEDLLQFRAVARGPHLPATLECVERETIEYVTMANWPEADLAEHLFNLLVNRLEYEIERERRFTLLCSEHYQRIRQFMRGALQAVPNVPTEIDEGVRKLRAAIVFEECLELIRKGLGVRVNYQSGGELDSENMEFEAIPGAFDLIETIDGVADLSVVGLGTLIACGVPDRPFLEEVDHNNLMKLGPGHTFREDGKLIKPLGHPKPNIRGVLDHINRI